MDVIPDNPENTLSESQGDFKRSLYWMLAGALLLVVPTVILLSASGLSDGFISSHLPDAWHDGIWQALRQALPRKGVFIALDGLTWLCVALFAVGYFRFLGQKKMPRITGRDLILLGCIGMLLTFVIPFHSRDVYGYINRGAQQAFYGVNPYMVPVGDMPNWQSDPVFQSHWLGNPCPYGFFYAQIAKMLASLGNHYFFPTFLIFKFSALLVHLLNSVLVYRLAILLSRPQPLRLALIYGLNPLVLMHQLANGHNDGFLALGLLGSLFALWQAKKVVWALPMLLLSVLTKYASFLASPFIVLDMLKRRQFAPLAIGASISLIFLAFLSWPYLQDWQHLPFDKMSENAGLSQHSIQSGIARLIFYTCGSFVPDKHAFLEMTRLTLKKFGFYGFIIFYGWRIWRFWKTPGNNADSVLNNTSSPKLLFEIVLAMAVYLLVANAKFHAWYLGMVLPAAFLLGTEDPSQRKLLSCLFWVSIFQLLSFTPLENIHVIGVLILTVLPVTLALRHSKFQAPRYF